MKKQFSIIIPAFNEQLRLGNSIKKILQYIKEEKLSAELIIVDDGSNDKTAETSEYICAKFPEIQTKVICYTENRGKGCAVKMGLLESEGEIALFSDADLSTPIEEMTKLVEPIQAGKFDITFGSRALDRKLIGVHQSWRREQGGRIFNLLVKILTRLPYKDTQCGFKAFKMKRFRPLLEVMQIDRFGFDVEFLFVANLYGLRLKEIPVRWNHDERSKVNFLRDSRRMFGEIRQIRSNAKRGIYDKVTAIGLVELSESTI